jgi:uncharacterized short protein YbdD (DUF466 family)
MPARLKTLLTRLRQAANLMVGLPDYRTYVQHRQTHHPGEPIMTYAAFFRNRQAARYGGDNARISRCC